MFEATLNQAVKIPYLYPVRKIKLDADLEIAYTDVGDPDAGVLLLVHGLGTGSPVWEKNIPVLSRHFRCLTIDLPGHGFSSRGTFSYTMDFYADVLVHFIDQLNLRNVTLMGHSMGGQISVLTTAKHPELVKKLVLVAPSGLGRHSALEMLIIGTLTSGMISSGNAFSMNRQNYVLGFCNNPEAADDLARRMVFFREDALYFGRMVQQSVQAMMLQPVSPFMSSIKQPTLVLLGKEDRLMPYQYLRPQNITELAEQQILKMHDGQLHVFSACGHFIQYQLPDRFNEVVLAFLKDPE